MTSGATRGILSGTAAIAAVLCGAAGLLGSAAAIATEWHPVPETGTPGRLVLDTTAHPMRIPELSPGDPARWQIHTRVDQTGRVRLDLALRKDGTLVTHADGLRIRVTACDEEWSDLATTPSCPGATSVVVSGPADSAAVTGATHRIGDARADGDTFLLVEFSVGDSPAAHADGSLMGLTATVGLGVTAASMPSATEDATPTAGSTASPSASPSPSVSRSASPAPAPVLDASAGPAASILAFTGGGFLGPVLVGAAVVLAGVAVRLRRIGREAR